MPYVILAIGIIITLFALYRFFIKASPEDIRQFSLVAFLITWGLVLLFFALSGRILIALALVVLSIPFAISYLKGKSTKKIEPAESDEDQDDDQDEEEKS